MSIAVFIFVLLGLAGAQQCNWIQLGALPCEYVTTECLKGIVQWNYPTKVCQWTFAPQGVSNFELSAFWATASYVNLTFYDGTDIASARRIGFEIGGNQDEGKINVTSTTGVLHVRLTGPPSMMTYALIFNYVITPKTAGCGQYNGDCARCLSAGCSMASTWQRCVSSCPTDMPCWTAPAQPTGSGKRGKKGKNIEQSLASAVLEVCTNRQAANEKEALCSSKTSCSSCLNAQCLWGGTPGADPICIAPNSSPLAWKGVFVDRCPGGKASLTPRALDVDVCSAQTTCEGCIDAGCAVMDLQGMVCAPQCYSDVPCFTLSPPKTAAGVCVQRRVEADKAALCASKNATCGECVDAGCQWNMLGAKGQKCITGCGFFPCEIKKDCEAGRTRSEDTLLVGGQRSNAFGIAASSVMILPLFSGFLL